MKRAFRFGVILSFVLLIGASLVPGPPERFKDWPLIAEREAYCRDGRALILLGYALKSGYEHPGFITITDKQGTFVWMFYTEKDEVADIRTVWAFDGKSFWQFDSVQELKDKFGPTPCDIPRPAPLKAL